jgi:L-threonylcarbamoyladenylate synthase
MESRFRTEILAADTPDRFHVAVEKAAEKLRRGELVALPTETVYGLAANAWDPVAVARIFELKRRPATNPIIVHVAGYEMALQCVSEWPDLAARLASAFWPGPLTLVLRRSEKVPDLVTAGGDTVGIRWPSHPMIQAVIQACGFPLAAPSANPAGQLSPTHPQHVLKSFDGRIPFIVDGGQSQIGIESTVVDLTGVPTRLLRPGMIGLAALVAAAGERIETAEGDEGVLKSPGMLLKHYSPKAALRVIRWQSEGELADEIARSGFPLDRVWVVAHSRVPLQTKIGNVTLVPADAEAFARALYSELHKADEAKAELILVEAPPDKPGWEAIGDRLRRASIR